MTTGNEYVSEPKKIAILMASLDERVAAGVLQQLDPEVIGHVANSIRRLGVITGGDREDALRHCYDGINAMSDAVSGDDKLAASLLSKAIGEKRASAMLADESTSSSSAFEDLLEVAPEQIVSGLGQEQPAILGIILRYLPADFAGKVLGLLPPEVRKKVVIHICMAREPDSATLQKIEEYVKEKFRKSERQEEKKKDSEGTLEIVASLLQSVDKSVSEELLAALETESSTLAGKIKDKLFTFDDIISLNDAAIRRILQEIDTGALAVALRNVSVDLKQTFFKNMSKRAAEGIREEMEFAQKMKLSDIQARQKEIVEVVRSLDSDGQITISGGGDEYV
jgi:flagellar motor switch protein FliG